MRKSVVSILALLLVAQMGWAVDSSTSLQTYYATANGKSNNELRLALHDRIKSHTDVGYTALSTLLRWADSEDADGQHIVDIYTNCTFTVSGDISWSSTGTVGAGMNREHTVPQSWFNSNAPMKADAFHVYATDCKANNNRNSFLYGEFEGAGTSYSSNKCAETGKLSTETNNSIAAYTYNDQTYTPTQTWSGKVYEPAYEYKGDLARSYFYMATCYADKCANWSGGAFGNDNNGLDDYTAQLMLKWHRLDPVSEKELIRNEVIYGNPLYNKGDKKQGNRNPFIDYPELVEYIWGDKKNVPVTLSALESLYANEGGGATDLENISLEQHKTSKVLVGSQFYIVREGAVYTLTGVRVR